MIWDIYSIGDSAYLAAILNAVAMVAGTADMRTLAGVGFLLGIILVAFQGILQGAQGIRFQNVLVAWIIYAGLFGTTAKVSIEDAYTGQVRVVDHVPFGPAFVGSTMSLVGYKLTSLFEQAFSTPAMTQGGFADPLQTLATVRKSMLTRAALAKANSPVPGADAEKTYTNYFDECVLRDVDAGARSIESVMSAQTWADFAVASDIWTTQIWTGGIARTLSCSDAWPEVNAFTANLFLPALQTMLQAALRLQNPGDVPGRVQAALDALGGLGQDAQNYMVMSALWPFLEQAKVQTHMNLHEFNAATTVEQAIAQRNGQWAAEASLFARIVRPMMTFFEGFIFAITPLMAFAVALGPTGIMMVGKWLLFGLWIQLWMPVLAIVNLYINLAAQRDMAAIENVELLPLSSFYGIMKSDVLIQDYLGVGGMLAASTPAISLMLIYGSAITATHLAGRLQGGDHIDEKLASPNVAKTGPGLQLLQRMTNEPTTGTVLHGAQGVLPTFSAGQAMERSVSSAEGHQTQAMESFARTLGVAGTKSAERRQASGTDYTQSENWTAGKSQTDGYLKDQAEGLIRQFGLSGKSTDAVGAALAAGITASASGGGEMTVRGAVSRALSASGTVGAGLQGQARGELKTDAGNSAEQVAQLTNAITRRVTSDTGMRAELAEREAHDETVNQTTIFTDGLGRQERSEVSRTANEAVSASRQYQEAQAAAQRVGSETRLTSPQMGLLIAANSGVMEELKRTVARHGLTGAAERLAAEHRYASSMPNRDQAYAAAAMSLLYGSNQPDSPRTPQETALMQDAGARLFGMVAGGYSGSAIDPYSQQPLTVGAPRSGEAQGAYAAEHRSDALGDARSLPGSVAMERARTQSTLAGGREAVESAGAANREQVQDGFAARQADLRADKREELGRRIRQQAGLARPLARWTHEEVGGLLRNTARIVGNVGSAVGSASDAATSFARTLAETKDPVAAWKAGGDAFTAEAKQAIGLRTDQLKGEHHLTDEQVALYRAALNSVAPEATGLQDMIGSEVAQARANLVAREGLLGEPMAELILRAASSEDDGGLRLIGAYNDAKDPGQVSVGTITTDPPPDGPPQASSGSAGAGEGTFRSKGEQAYGPQIVAMARAHGVDPAFALAVARRESNFDQNAVSPKGAVGLMQLMPATAERFGVSDRSDPEQNIRGGVRYLKWLSEQFDGDPSLVAAGYNAGEGAVAKYGNQVPPYAETRDYVERVTQHRAAYLQRLG